MLKKIDKPLLIVSTILFILGIIMIYSASSVTSVMRYGNAPYYFALKQAIIIIVMFITSMIVICLFDNKTLGWISILLMIGFMTLLVVLLLYGKFTNKARSWIDLGIFTLQPSEFVKIVSVTSFALIADLYIKNTNKKPILYFLILCIALTTLFIILQPDYGTAIIYALIMGFLILGLPWFRKNRWFVRIAIVFLLVIVTLSLFSSSFQNLIFQERQINRIIQYKNPCGEDKIYDSGLQVCNGYIAFNNGGLFGKGLGNSTQKYLYLPEAYSDFIFAIIVEETGFLGGTSILLLELFVLWRIFIIGKKSNSNMNRFICKGVFLYILIHISVNLFGVLGLLPSTGVPLPFMSYGGSFVICLVFALAFVQRVSIENKLELKE